MLNMARLMLTYNPLTASDDSVCRRKPLPEVGGIRRMVIN